MVIPKDWIHYDVIKWKHFPRNWPIVRGIHRSPVNSPHKGQWRGALMFSLIGAWINGWVNNREAGDLRRYRAHYDVIVMCIQDHPSYSACSIHFFDTYIYIYIFNSSIVNHKRHLRKCTPVYHLIHDVISEAIFGFLIYCIFSYILYHCCKTMLRIHMIHFSRGELLLFLGWKNMPW